MQYIEINHEFDINKKFKNDDTLNLLFSSFPSAVHYSKDKYFYRLIIQPKPTWLTHEDLWESGFGAFWDMAHEEQNKKFIIIIQNYNIALADCYGLYLWNIINGYTNSMPLSKYKNKGRPENLWIYLSPVVDDKNELMLSESKYVLDTISNKFTKK